MSAPTDNTARQLHTLGQSLWLDNITRSLISTGQLQRYIDDFAVTGLTSNPTIFDEAIKSGSDYDESIGTLARAGLGREAIFFRLAIDDLRAAAELFLPIHRATRGIDGWVSLEVSPELVDDAAGTEKVAQELFRLADRPNLYIKIPGTPSGLRAIEATIAAGVPVNVTLLFSREQYLAAAEAYLRGIERRLQAGLDPKVSSVASLFVSRWDSALAKGYPGAPPNRLGVSIATQAYQAYGELLESPRWRELERQGAVPQRLLFASTGVKDPALPAAYYVEALAAPGTINTMPEKTLRALSGSAALESSLIGDGASAAEMLAVYARAGVDRAALAAKLQTEGAQSFSESWRDLMSQIDTKSRILHSS